MAKFKGRFMGLWVADSSPALPATTANYTFVGHADAHDLNVSVDQIDAASKDTGSWGDNIDGRRNYAIQVNGKADRTGDAGVDIIESAVADDTKELWWLLTTGVAGDDQRYGKASIGDFSLSYPDQDVSTYSFTLNGKGAYTKVKVAAS